MKQKKVLIAGAAGFLGSHLSEALITSGLKVVGIDNWTTGKRENVERLLDDPQFDFIEVNINQRIPDALSKEEWLAIVHVANVEAFSATRRLELNELLTNSFGVKNLLDLALKTKSRFVLTSTIDLYQGLASHADLSHYYENVEQRGVLTLTEAKRYAEALCQEYVSLYGMDIRVARLSDVYGPRMNLEADSIIAKVLAAALENKNLILDDVGSRTIFATFYSDVVYGLQKLIVQDDTSLKGGIFYLVNKEPVSLLSIVLTIKEYAPHDISVEFLPRVKDPLFHTPVIDITRSRNELYWEAKVSLQEGIKKAMVYFLSGKKHQPLDKLSDKKPVAATTLHVLPGEVEENVSKKKDTHIDTPPLESPLSPPKAESTEQEQVEADVLHDIIEDIQEVATVPALESPPPRLQVQPASGWLSLKQKASTLSTRSVPAIQRTPHWVRQALIAICTVLFVWYVLVPLVGLAFYALSGTVQVRSAKAALAAGNYNEAEDNMRALSTSFENAGTYWKRTGWFWGLLGKQEMHAAGKSWAVLGQEVAKASEYGIAFIETTQPWWGPTLSGKDETRFSDNRTDERIAQSQSEWRLFRQHVAIAEELTNVPALADFPVAQSILLSYADRIRQLSEVTNIEADAWQYLPGWFGYEGSRTALIWLQNNSELRPTGGFIGSYALLTMENGIISSLQVDDIYNPDGQLELKVDPATNIAPDGVRTYLNSGQLTLRDTNWWYDFPTSASRFAQLFPQATGVTPDWIVGINLTTIEDVLRVIGPLELPVTKELVTADTLFEKAQTASEVGFEPGSTGKKDFIGEVAQQLWLRLFPVAQDKLFPLARALFDELGTGQILMYATRPDWQADIASASFAGVFDEVPGDSLAVVSSNVGINKANHWVKRATRYSVFVDRDEAMRAKLDITFTHTGVSETWPNGLYKDYLRVYLPDGVTVNSATGFTDTYQVYSEFGRQVVVGLLEVPLSSERTVSLTYQLPTTAFFGDDATYSLSVYGQPGLIDEPFSFDLQLPFYLDFMKASPGVEINDQKVVSWVTSLRNRNSLSISVFRQQ